MSQHRPFLESALRCGFAPGIVAKWGRGDPSTTEALGHAAVAPAMAVTEDTWFDLASLTKPLATGVLSILAFRSGELTPETSVGEVLRETHGTPIADVTVSQLLTHTSGLPAWLPLYCLAEGRTRDVPQRLGEIGLEYAPGTKVVYSCIGYVTLGLMLSRVSGQKLDALFSELVLAPMNLLGELGFRPDPSVHPLSGGAAEPRVELAAVSDIGLDPAWIPATGLGLPDDGNARFLGGISGNAGLFGTARGVFRVTREFLTPGGTILAPNEANDATSCHTPGLQQARGFGWQLAASPGCSAGPALSERAFGHTGFTGVSVWADPTQSGVFVLLSNRNHPSQRQVDLHPLRRRFHALASQSL